MTAIIIITITIIIIPLTFNMFRVWWWSILVFFEKNIKHPLPNEFEIPRLAVSWVSRNTVKPLIKNTSKEFIKCRILHFLIMECCRYLVFLIKIIIWNSLKLFPHIHGYLFIFANTEIYVIKYKTYWKIVKTTFDKFFRCIRY